MVQIPVLHNGYVIKRRVPEVVVLVSVQFYTQTGRYAAKTDTFTHLPDGSTDRLQPEDHTVCTAVATAEKHLHDDVKILSQINFVRIPDGADPGVLRRCELITVIVKSQRRTIQVKLSPQGDRIPAGQQPRQPQASFHTRIVLYR